MIWYSPLKDFWSSYRKLAWVGFESTTTEFRSDAQTDWAIRPWVELTLRADFVQLLQFHLFVQCSHFSSVIPFVSWYICFKRNLAQVITLVAEWIDIYIYIYIYIYFAAISVVSSEQGLYIYIYIYISRVEYDLPIQNTRKVVAARVRNPVVH